MMVYNNMDSCSESSSKFLLFNNVVLHILILFAILYGIFMLVITKLTIKEFGHQFDTIVDKSVPPGIFNDLIKRKDTITVEELGNLVKIDPNDPIKRVQLEALLEYIKRTNPEKTNKFFRELSKHYSKTPNPLRESINSTINQEMLMGIGFMILIAIFINLLLIKLGNCNMLKVLGIELLVIFSFVGAIEFWFFTNVAKKFVPVTPDVLIKSFKKSANSVIQSNSSS
jgi:hypothetical protein